MKQIAFGTLCGISLLILTSCGQSTTPVKSEAELVGGWSLTELRTHKGNRGPATGILEGEFVFNGDGSCSNRLQWSKEATGKEEPVVGSTGTWTLSNQFLILRGVGTNDAPARSRVWFEGGLLVLEPAGEAGKAPGLTFYLSRVR
jgi:hypothetical protein